MMDGLKESFPGVKLFDVPGGNRGDDPVKEELWWLIVYDVNAFANEFHWSILLIGRFYLYIVDGINKMFLKIKVFYSFSAWWSV